MYCLSQSTFMYCAMDAMSTIHTKTGELHAGTSDLGMTVNYREVLGNERGSSSGDGMRDHQ